MLRNNDARQITYIKYDINFFIFYLFYFFILLYSFILFFFIKKLMLKSNK
jgi:hypothetical protein